MSAALIPPKLDMKKKFFWLITLLVPVIILLIPVTATFTRPIKLFLAITICAILMFAFELMDNFVPAVLLPIGYTLCGVVPSGVAFAPWTSSIPWMMIGSLVLINCVERVGLLKRAAYFVNIKTGGSYQGVIYGFMLAGIVINLILPGALTIPLIALSYGICVALELGRSKTSAGIMIGAAIAAMLPAYISYNPIGIGIIMGLATEAFGIELSWLQNFAHNLIFLPWCLLMAFVTTKLFKPDVAFQGKAYFEQEYAALGKTSLSEKKAAIVVILLAIFLVTDSLHHLDKNWGWIFAAVATFFPGVNIGIKQDIEKLNFSLVVFVASCLTIGTVSGAIGIGQIISAFVMPYMQNSGSLALIAIVWVIAAGFNFLLTPLAEIAALTVPMLQITLDMGISPYPVLYAFQQGLDQIIFPYEYFNYLFLFSFGLIASKDFMKFFAVKMGLNFLFVLIIAVPYWMLIGLL